MLRRLNNVSITLLVLAIAAAFGAVGCASSVVINSDPPGAKVYLNGQVIGKTPVTYTDTAIVGTVHSVQLKKEGFQTQQATISRNNRFNVGACIGGVLVLVPFLWIMDYPAFVNYELERATASAGGAAPAYAAPPAAAPVPPAAGATPAAYPPPPQ